MLDEPVEGLDQSGRLLLHDRCTCRFSNVGYWTELPQDADAPIVLASPAFQEVLDKRLGDTHLMNTMFQMRPNVFMVLWPQIHPEWENYLKAKKAAEKDTPE